MSLNTKDFQEALEKAGLLSYFTNEGLSALVDYTNKMLTINETLNLTRWTKDEDVLRFHLLDSAYSLPLIKPFLKKDASWLDLGTGCGYPGVVLLAAFPELELSLMDSVGKKIKAVEESLLETQWKTRCLTGRAEEFGKNPQYRENWDGVVARAVADFPVVLEYGLPLLKPGGYLVNWMTEEQMKTVDKSQTVLSVLKAKIVKTSPYSLLGSDQTRWYVLVEKLGKTPEGYPRPIGKATKHPIQ